MKPVPRSVVDLPALVRNRSRADTRAIPSGRQLAKSLVTLNENPRTRRLLVRTYETLIRPLQDRRSPVHLPYPLIGGYSDIVVVNRDHLQRISERCGVFAATNLFVELAIPTAMLLTTSNFVTEMTLTRRGLPLGNEPGIGDRRWQCSKPR